MTFQIGFNPVVAVIVMAVLDAKFREALTKDLGGALEGSGLKLDPNEMETIKSLKPETWDTITLKELNIRLSNTSVLSGETGGIDPGKLITGGIDPGSL